MGWAGLGESRLVCVGLIKGQNSLYVHKAFGFGVERGVYVQFLGSKVGTLENEGGLDISEATMQGKVDIFLTLWPRKG